MRLQAAMEYLMTYGWALVILALVLTGLFVLGFFNISTYTTQECVMSGSFSCLNFYMPVNGVLSVNLQQVTGDSINVTMLGCNQNGTISNMKKAWPPLPTGQLFLSSGNNQTFSVQCYVSKVPYNGVVGTIVGLVFLVNYTDDFTHLQGTATGKINVKIS